MKLQGKLLGVFRDIHTGEITKTFEETNHIQNYYYDRIYNSGNGQLYDQLFISSQNPGKQKRTWPSVITGVKSGAAIGGVSTRAVSLYDSPGIHLITFARRFTAPASDYTINIAGICSYFSTATTAQWVDAVAWLSTPCIQTTTETLDLYYRVQATYDEDWLENSIPGSKQLNGPETLLWARNMFWQGTSLVVLPNQSYLRAIAFPKMNVRLLGYFPHTSPGDKITNVSRVDAHNQTYYRRRVNVNLAITDTIGVVMGALATRDNATLSQKIFNNGESPIQSIFGHRSTSNTPFFNSANSQLGNGTVVINGDGWTDPDFSKHLTVDIITDGILGVGEYRFKMRNMFGFYNNSYLCQPVTLPSSSGPNAHFLEDFVVARDTGLANNQEKYRNAFPKRYSDTQILCLWNDSFAVMDLTTGAGPAFFNTTIVGADLTPRFLATDIRQTLPMPNGDLYVTCGDTGLYRFSSNFTVLDVFDTNTTGLSGVDGCYGVCVGNAGRLWGYFGHTTTPDLYYSDDNGATWTAAGFSHATLDATPGKVVAIEADPNNVDGQIALVYHTSETSTTIHTHLIWWDQLTLTATYQGELLQDNTSHTTFLGSRRFPIEHGHKYFWSDFIKCSPNQSIWGTICWQTSYNTYGKATVLNFGATGRTTSPFTDDGTNGWEMIWKLDDAGLDAFFYLTTREQNFNRSIYGMDVVLMKADFSSYESAALSGSADGYANYYRDRYIYIADDVFVSAAVTASTIANTNYLNIWNCMSNALADRDPVNNPGLEKIITPTYGWNGSAWERNNPNGKPTHAALEELIDGITMSFDDNAGAAPMLASDHYTCGIVDGILTDGSTTATFRLTHYLKPTIDTTVLEAAILPAVQKVPNIFTEIEPSVNGGHFQDLLQVADGGVGRFTYTGTGLAEVYSAQARSSIPVINGSVSSFNPNANLLIDDEDYTNVQGWIEFRPEAYYTVLVQSYVGLSDASVLGTTLDVDTIQYAIHVDNQNVTAGYWTVRVVESGIERFTTVQQDTQYAHFRIVLLNNGKMLYQRATSSSPTAWYTMYESPAAGLVTIQDYYMDVASAPTSGWGVGYISFFSLDTNNADYYLLLGDGVDKGLNTPDFFAVDPETLVLTIDGSEAVQIGNDDTDTVLSANAYSPFPFSGVLRYSAADVGKSVSASYLTISDS